ncbi:hypothetical protein ZIOFF_040523 [Zingiber officinale]|uniref:TFIIB-type domain-containing protein n=1 Tax=Zingiber officinale TaxID=94328 RepID=A0A8J5G453_ZINOF|nr:hypothetical protein ZIOFF_040523 [Zingiber officinale]
MADAFCPDCKRSTEVVFDHSAGDTVCSECGLVLEAHAIDETSEWRTFANESADNDPVRVGGPSNPLLTDGGLSTVISKPNGTQAEFLSSSLGRWQSRGANPDRNLILAFKTIATMADRFDKTTMAYALALVMAMAPCSFTQHRSWSINLLWHLKTINDNSLLEQLLSTSIMVFEPFVTSQNGEMVKDAILSGPPPPNSTISHTHLH